MGRKPKDINWDEVEMMMLAGSSGIEIAGAFGISHDKFYARFKQEYNESFGLASQNKKEGGKARLRHAQMKNALKGNTALLIKLGEIMLGQGKESNIPSEATENDLIVQNARLEVAVKELQDKLNAIESQASSLDCSSDTQI